MEDSTRGGIATLVATKPGWSTTMIAEALAVDETTARYHLRRLEREGVIECDRDGREARWFSATCGLCPVQRRLLPAMRRDGVRRLAAAITALDEPVAVLADRAGLARGAARHSATVLLRAGVARRGAQGAIARAEGASVCFDKVAEGLPCPLWGSCPVSRELEAASREPDL